MPILAGDLPRKDEPLPRFLDDPTFALFRPNGIAAGHALGQKVHEEDRWIAATALALGVELIPGDAVFENVAGLVLRAPPA